MKTGVLSLLVSLLLLGSASRVRADLVCETNPISKLKVILSSPEKSRADLLSIFNGNSSGSYAVLIAKYEPGFLFKKTYYKFMDEKIVGSFVIVQKNKIGRGGCGRGSCDDSQVFPTTASAELNLYGIVTNFVCKYL